MVISSWFFKGFILLSGKHTHCAFSFAVLAFKNIILRKCVNVVFFLCLLIYIYIYFFFFPDWNSCLLSAYDTTEAAVSGCEEQDLDRGPASDCTGQQLAGSDNNQQSHEPRYAVQKGGFLLPLVPWFLFAKYVHAFIQLRFKMSRTVC